MTVGASSVGACAGRGGSRRSQHSCCRHRRCWLGNIDKQVLACDVAWLTLSTQQHLAARFARGTTVISSNQPAQEGQLQETRSMMSRHNRCEIRHPSRPHRPPQGKPLFAYFLLAWTKSKAPGGGASPRS